MLFYKENGVWKEVSKVFVKENGVWNEVSHIGTKDGEWNVQNYLLNYIPSRLHVMKEPTGSSNVEAKLLYNLNNDVRKEGNINSLTMSTKNLEQDSVGDVKFYVDKFVETVIDCKGSKLDFSGMVFNTDLDVNNSGEEQYIITIRNANITTLHNLIRKAPKNTTINIMDSVVVLSSGLYNNASQNNLKVNIKNSNLTLTVHDNYSISNSDYKTDLCIDNCIVENAYSTITSSFTSFNKISITNSYINAPLKFYNIRVLEISNCEIKRLKKPTNETNRPYLLIEYGSNKYGKVDAVVVILKLSNLRLYESEDNGSTNLIELKTTADNYQMNALLHYSTIHKVNNINSNDEWDRVVINRDNAKFHSFKGVIM